MQENTLNNFEVPTQNTSSDPNQVTASPVLLQEKKSPLVPILIALLVVSLSVAAYFYSQNKTLRNENVTSNTMEQKLDEPIATVTPLAQIEATPITENMNTNEQLTQKTYTHNKFSITYGADWKMLNTNSAEEFPLFERFNGLYKSEDVIALRTQRTSDSNVSEVFVVITFDPSKEGSFSGGTFADEDELNTFMKRNQKITIAGETFYLSRFSDSIKDLGSAESGPWGWGALIEYTPNKTLESGATANAYQNVITRNGTIYNIILASQYGGEIDPTLQKDIIDLLKTIKW